MNRPSVVHILEQIQEFLDSDGVLFLPQQLRDDWLNKTRSLLEKARERGELLYVGILGGTGVGKSTLIIALAGEKIVVPCGPREVVVTVVDAEANRLEGRVNGEGNVEILVVK